MEKRIAQAISVVFHPLLIPTYLLLLVLNLDIYFSLMIPFKGKVLMTALVFLTTAVLPSFLIMIYYRMGWIKSVYLEERKDRMLPLFTAGLMYLVAAFMLRNLQIGSAFFFLLLGAAVITILVMLVTNFWKISVHAASAGGMLGAMVSVVMKYGVDMIFMVYLITLLGGIIGYARLKLKAHHPAQVYVGYVAGFISMFLLFLYL